MAFSKKEIKELLFSMPFEELQKQAFKTRLQHKGKHVFLRGLLEFSNYCYRNCKYCGLQTQNKALQRYTMTMSEILEACIKIKHFGMDTIVLQSGEWNHPPDWIAELIDTLKNNFALPITLSIGEHSKENYALWKRAGADRFLLRHETADRDLYHILHPGYSLKNRIQCLYTLKKLGYEIGSGFLVGVPYQNPNTLINDIF